MNQDTFLKALRKALLWTCNSDEIKDILSDYEGFFADGHAEGKDDGQICVELGNPTTIALELAERLEKKKRLPKLVLGRILVGAALLSLSIIYIATRASNPYILRDSMIILIVFTALLWFALGGTVKTLPPVHRTAKKFNSLLIGAAHITLLGIVAGFFITLWKLLHGQIANLAFLNTLHPALTFLASLIGALSLYGYYRRSAHFYTVLIHTVGVISYLSAMWNLLGSMDSLEGFVKNCLLFTSVYLVSILLSAFSALWIRTLSRRQA